MGTTRRNFIAGLTGLLGMEATHPLSALAAPQTGMERLQSIIARHDYTLIASPDHRQDIPFFDFLRTRATITLLKDAGVKSLGLEFFSRDQPDVDALAASPRSQAAHLAFCSKIDATNRLTGLDENQKRQAITSLAWLIEGTAQLSDIRIVFPDRPDLAKYLDKYSYLEQLNVAKESQKAGRQLTIEEAVQTMSPADVAVLTDALAKMLAERMSKAMNAKILDTFDVASPPGYPRVIAYGPLHIPAMREVLKERGHSVAVVAMHVSAPGMKKDIAMSSESGHGDDYQDAMHFLIDEKRFAPAPKPPVPVQLPKPDAAAHASSAPVQ